MSFFIGPNLYYGYGEFMGRDAVGRIYGIRFGSLWGCTYQFRRMYILSGVFGDSIYSIPIYVLQYFPSPRDEMTLRAF